MGVGRYVTNMGVIGSLLGALGVRKQTKEMPADWRRYVVWLSWVLSFILAVASVRKSENDKDYIARGKAARKEHAKREKAAKKAAKRVR
ncbi:hypothetical protein [Canibacter zhoujuaniae]|uniref:hypothetical protein n=1 Tax=Canibacter zhoujuaniae TaxID=2708343 RepID=UPI0014200567|nr:hypothetical protein [Canibacter zhoujuaniae]